MVNYRERIVNCIKNWQDPDTASIRVDVTGISIPPLAVELVGGIPSDSVSLTDELGDQIDDANPLPTQDQNAILSGDSINYDMNINKNDIGLPEVPSVILDGEKLVAAAASPEAIGAATVIKHSVVVQAKITNTNPVFIGNVGGQHLELDSGESTRVHAKDLANIFCKVTTNGEGVNYFGG